MVIFFIVWRKRQKRLKREHGTHCESKASSSCAANMSYRSPPNDILTSSRHPGSNFDALAMVQRESVDRSKVQQKGETELEDDSESSSWCSTCGWSDDSDEEMEHMPDGMGEIRVDLPRKSKQTHVERRCSKGCKGRVSRKCSKIRSQEAAISGKCRKDSISVLVKSRTPFCTGIADGPMKEMMPRGQEKLENNVLYEQSPGDEHNSNGTAALGNSPKHQDLENTSVTSRPGADDPMLEKHSSDPNSVVSGWMALSKIGNCVAPDGKSVTGKGNEVHRRLTAPC